ncbi:MAG: DoxX family protein [Saprospiraceae bacterium]|mgnify:FL=1|nr:DoxX family protein [Candidatus Defluviibacterium haderslevense]
METQSMSKTRKIINWIFVGLMSALFIMSATMKLMAGADAEIAVNFVKWGLEGKLMLIGMGELIAAILFLIPRTSSLGVLLLSAHLGGAIATHMEHGEMFIPQAIMLLLVWVANYLRNPEMLSSFFKK